MDKEMWINAIYRANKIGAKGLQIVGIAEPQSATADRIIIFTITKPQETAASTPWYDK